MGQPSTFRPRDIKQGTTSCPMCGGTNTRIHVGAAQFEYAKKASEKDLDRSVQNARNLDEVKRTTELKGGSMSFFASALTGEYEEAGDVNLTLGFDTKKGCKYCGYEGET